MKIANLHLRRIVLENIRREELISVIYDIMMDNQTGDREEDFLAAKDEIELDGEATADELKDIQLSDILQMRGPLAMEQKTMKITKNQLRRIIKEAVYDQMSYDLGLSTEDGLRTPLAKLLASVARSEPAGWEPRTREEKDMMLDLKEKGLVNYGLDPRGGYRGHITDLGRKGIQGI